MDREFKLLLVLGDTDRTGIRRAFSLRSVIAINEDFGAGSGILLRIIDGVVSAIALLDRLHEPFDRFDRVTDGGRVDFELDRVVAVGLEVNLVRDVSGQSKVGTDADCASLIISFLHRKLERLGINEPAFVGMLDILIHQLIGSDRQPEMRNAVRT